MKVTVSDSNASVTLETQLATASEMYDVINRALLACGYDITICEIVRKEPTL